MDHPAASGEEIVLNAPHQPTEKAFEAFAVVEATIKEEIVKSRRNWNHHEPKMWSRAAGLSDAELVSFSVAEDLVEIRSAPTSYGTIILGKLRIPAINDEEGEGFVHVRYARHFLWRMQSILIDSSCFFFAFFLASPSFRIHDPPNRVRC